MAHIPSSSGTSTTLPEARCYSRPRVPKPHHPIVALPRLRLRPRRSTTRICTRSSRNRLVLRTHCFIMMWPSPPLQLIISRTAPHLLQPSPKSPERDPPNETRCCSRPLLHRAPLPPLLMDMVRSMGTRLHSRIRRCLHLACLRRARPL